MAIEKKTAKQNYEVKVLRVHDFGKGQISVDLTVNGVTIYGCRHITMANGNSFIAFPQYKDKDGKYWNYAYFNIDAELLKDIETKISDML